MIDASLRSYLATAARRGLDWRWQCGFFLADWVLEATGHDPAAAWRAAYDGPRAALRLQRELGGLWTLTYRLAGEAGLPMRLTDPQPGDVGVVLAGCRQAGAIRTGKGWAVLKRGGYAVLRLPALGAWGVL